VIGQHRDYAVVVVGHIAVAHIVVAAHKDWLADDTEVVEDCKDFEWCRDSLVVVLVVAVELVVVVALALALPVAPPGETLERPAARLPSDELLLDHCSVVACYCSLVQHRLLLLVQLGDCIAVVLGST
jgi:hypothetical protein